MKPKQTIQKPLRKATGHFPLTEEKTTNIENYVSCLKGLKMSKAVCRKMFKLMLFYSIFYIYFGFNRFILL